MAEPRVISLTRNDEYSEFMAVELMSIKQDRELTDFTLKIGPESLPCHKLMLAVHSPVLKAMLLSGFVESTKHELTLDHISVDIMKIILDFMYSCNMSVREDQLVALIRACDYFQITLLKKMCLDDVPGILNSSNVMSFLTIADIIKHNEIRTRCSEIFTSLQDISKQEDFLSLDFTELQDYLDAISKCNIRTDNVLGAAVQWVSHDVDSRSTHLENLLQKIQLAACSPRGIKVMLDAHAGLFNSKEAYKILNSGLLQMAMCRPDTKRALVLVETWGETVVTWFLQGEAERFAELCRIQLSDLSTLNSVCKVPQGFAITGGKNKLFCAMFIAASCSWSRLENLLTGRWQHGSVCVRGVIYALGGLTGDVSSTSRPNVASSGFTFGSVSAVSDAASKTVECLKIGSNKWQKGPDMPFTVSRPKVSNIDDNVYLLDPDSKQLLHLDVDRNVWNKRAAFPGPSCSDASMTAARGRLYLGGGQARICASYNPATDAWWLGQQQPPRAHTNSSLVFHQNKLILLGGATIEVSEYDLEEDTWSVCDFKIPSHGILHGVVLDIPKQG